MTSSSQSEFAGLDPELLKILACPKCKGALQQNVAEISLDCHTCKLRYVISDGIPNLLIDEALPLEI